MTKRILALTTLTILAAVTILFYNSSTAVNKFVPVAINSNSNIPTTTGIQSQNEISPYFIASASPTANQLYPTNDLVNSKAWYQVIFTTGTTAAIKQVEVEFPPGTDIANAKLVDTTGLGPGTYTISGQTITYTVAPEILVPANTELRLQYDNILNPSIPDSNLTIRISTKDTAGSVIDSGTSLAYKIRQIGTEDISNRSITREKIEPSAVVPVVSLRSSKVVSIPPQQDESAVAGCSDGEVATGGGYITNSPNVTVTFSSLGDEPKLSWVIHAVNTDTVAHNITATVICLHLSP
ncbi:MAG TPA: hypothetical protein VH481_08445 [Nitrososphaeraceae archaeon]